MRHKEIVWYSQKKTTEGWLYDSLGNVSKQRF